MNSYHREMDETNILNHALQGRFLEHYAPRDRWFSGTPNRALFYAVPDHEALR